MTSQIFEFCFSVLFLGTGAEDVSLHKAMDGETALDLMFDSGVDALVVFVLFLCATGFIQWRDQQLRQKAKQAKLSSVEAPKKGKCEVVQAKIVTETSWKAPVVQKQMPESVHLVTAIRNGAIEGLPRKLRETCFEAAEDKPESFGSPAHKEFCCQLAASTIRACVTRRFFLLSLNLFEEIEDMIGDGSGDLYSILLYSSVEARRFSRGMMFYRRLRDMKVPETYDYVNMVRCLAYNRDISSFRRLLRDIKRSGFIWDSTARNKVFAACSEEGAWDFAEIVMESGICKEATLDIADFNVFLKGCLKAKEPARCFSFKKQMEASGSQPNAETYALLLDAAAKIKDEKRVNEALENLRTPDVAFNSVNHMSALKNLVFNGMVNEAEKFLSVMESQGRMPNAACYTTILKGYAEKGQFAESVALLNLMKKKGGINIFEVERELERGVHCIRQPVSPGSHR